MDAIARVPGTATDPQWRKSLAVLFIVVVGVAISYRATFSGMVETWWRSETFNHCFLIPPISLWLIWRMRGNLARLVPAPSPGFTLLMVLAGAGWLAGELAAVNAVTQLAMVSVILLAVPAILGLQVARAISFPLGFMYFAVPVGEFVMPWMMEWTADFTVFAVALSGVPVYREGQHFVIPSGSWSVVEACSGVRYLIASITVGTLFAYLNYRSTTRRWLFVGFAIAVPIVANWLRAYMIVMLGHLSNNRIAVGVDHLLYGWVFFGVVIIIMFAVGARWSEPEAAEESAGGDAPSPAPGRWPPILAGGAAFLAALLPVVTYAALERAESSVRAGFVFPLEVDGWTRLAQAPDWQPPFGGTVASGSARFTKDALEASLYVGYFRKQTFDRKLVSAEKVLVKTDDTTWARVKSGSRDAEFAGRTVMLRTAELRVNREVSAGAEPRFKVQWFYWIDGHLTASDYWARAMIAWARLKGHGDGSAVIVYIAPEGRAGGGDAAIAALMQASGAGLDAALRAAGGRE